MLQHLLSYVRSRDLLRAGDRVGVAVSGGADSVALLRSLLELRTELGIVLSVVHFHHGIRGSEADADAAFVGELAKRFDLPLHQASGDAPFFAKKWHLGLEAAARRLRYEMFRAVLRQGGADKICTAHTRDDQAETVLLKMLRGAGTRGLAGIHPELKLEAGSIIRPLLETSREEIVTYLTSIGQSWREDSSNLETKHTRNRIRHELLPLLERDYNPSLRTVLSETAEVAREEEEFWNHYITSLAQHCIEQREDSVLVRLGGSLGLVKAIKRRMIRYAAERVGLALDFHHVEQVLSQAQTELPNGWSANWMRETELTLRKNQNEPSAQEYDLELPVPGSVPIPALGVTIRVTEVSGKAEIERYNPATLLDRSLLRGSLRVRNWRAGDRFHPLHRGSEEKLKRLFQEKRVSADQRLHWPVVVCTGRVIWAKGFPVEREFAITPESTNAVLIEILE